jgi:HD-GYP domain-containing protein (c-di-GMP phosphodiesterase class II)
VRRAVPSSKRPSLLDIYSTLPEVSTDERLRRLELLHRIGISLSAEQNKDRLIETILIESKELCNADGGTLYLKGENHELTFEILINDSLGLHLGGTTGTPVGLPPIPMRDEHGGANHKNVASYAAWLQRSVNIPDAYDAEGFDFSGTKNFDEKSGYRSKSFLTIPLVNNEGLVIGVLQLLNARDRATGELVHFSIEDQLIVEALASQAGIALDNQLLLDGQKTLLESFIRLIAAAIDAKSAYTGGHCERVPVLTEMLTRSVCDAESGPFAGFSLSEDEWYELHIAAWLHDCGKVTTPVHVMDKATKLETIFDRIEIVRARFEVLRRDAELTHRKRLAEPDADSAKLERDYQAALASLADDLAFLERANVGGEYLAPEQQRRIVEIGSRRLVLGGVERPLLDEGELENLSISRGTLTAKERLVINGHMVHTIKMLLSLPFPRNLKRVPEYAGGHHEKVDGTGYPRGLFAGDMSVPARIMAIADVFEALTAADRPYKPGKKLSEAMRIMGFMKRDNHLDPALFDHFVTSGVYREYAARFLPPEQIDAVNEAELLAIQPKAFELPPFDVRRQRWQGFLPEYDG